DLLEQRVVISWTGSSKRDEKEAEHARRAAARSRNQTPLRAAVAAAPPCLRRKDQEVNRHFFEDILGLPLVATWCERTFHPDFAREVDYCHTFFGLADGGALAFFQFADADAYETARAILPPGG